MHDTYTSIGGTTSTDSTAATAATTARGRVLVYLPTHTCTRAPACTYLDYIRHLCSRGYKALAHILHAHTAISRQTSDEYASVVRVHHLGRFTIARAHPAPAPTDTTPSRRITVLIMPSLFIVSIEGNGKRQKMEGSGADFGLVAWSPAS